MEYYVYEHWRPDTGLPFYVGKGRGSRAGVIKGRGEAHAAVLRALSNLGLKHNVRVVAGGLEEKQAFLLEVAHIALLKEQEIPLVNLTNGGDGTWGLKYTEKRRRKLSKALKGQKRTLEQRARMREAQKRRPPISEETREKLSIAGKSRKLTRKHKKNISVSLLGKPKSEEHRAAILASRPGIVQPKRSLKARKNMSRAQKKRVLPPEIWARIGAAVSSARKGRTPSEETRKKMSASQTGRKHSTKTKRKMRLKALEREARKRAKKEKEK